MKEQMSYKNLEIGQLARELSIERHKVTLNKFIQGVEIHHQSKK